MQLYFAPLEGITTYTYRNTHAACFGGCDAYYAPFVTPAENEKIGRKNVRDILPEHNQNVNLKVQVLANKSDAFLKFAEKIKPLGYDEVNINLGCPSPTVVKKGRGAGFLNDVLGMKRFFDEIFEACDIKISVKTRTGYVHSDEMDELMEIYSRHPLSLLIIHPRTKKEFYGGEPNLAVFARALDRATCPVCYNGDVLTVGDFREIEKAFPSLRGVMIGRGAVKNPALFREIRGGKPLATCELVHFSEQLIENYMQVLQSETFTLHKLKEIWSYMIRNFPEEKKIQKAIKKANTLSDFKQALWALPALESDFN